MAIDVKYDNITLETIDRAIYDWLNKTVDSHVAYPNGERKKVPIVMASGERWVTARERKGLRDGNGVLILPIVSLRRSMVDTLPTSMTLGTETANIQISRRVSKKTNELMNLRKLRNAVFRNSIKPTVYEVFTIPFPDRCKVVYELQVQTQYITQMNTILEKLFHELDISRSFVAPFDNDGRHPPLGEEFKDRGQIRGSFVVGFFGESINGMDNFEEFTDQERIVRFSTSIEVPTVLQLDPEGEKPTVNVSRTAFSLGFSDESVHFVDNIDELEDIFG